MRRLLLAALLAGATTPALALAPDSDRKSVDRAERGERAQARSERSSERSEQPRARSPRAERPQVQRERTPKLAGERRLTPRSIETPAPDRVRPEQGRAERRLLRDDRVRDRRLADGQGRGAERGARTPRGDGLVEQGRPLPRVLDRDGRRRISRTPVAGTEPPAPPTATARHARPDRNWRNDWRRDRRYDWRDHRRRHRSLFRLGLYYDPFGWNYQRYGIGWRLWPSHYSSRYWLNDPWMYRLPPAYGPYRWVRYWDDALLVNIYTGEVVDVIHNVFW